MLQSSRKVQHHSNSLTGALGGDEDIVMRGYQMSYMMHVPQSLYTPRPYEAVFAKEPNILFDVNGQCGISLHAALHMHGPSEWDAEFMDCFSRAKKITIRVLWPGYRGSDLQIAVRNDKREPMPITKTKLAHNVAKALRKIIDEHIRQGPSTPGYEQWHIGSMADLSNIFLTELRHVSKGSWQPVLYVAVR